MDFTHSCLCKDLRYSQDTDFTLGSIPPCPAEDIFLCRLLEKDVIRSSKDDGSVGYVKEALASRQTSTRELMKLLEDAIDSQRTKFEGIAQILLGKPSAEGCVLDEEADNLVSGPSVNQCIIFLLADMVAHT